MALTLSFVQVPALSVDDGTVTASVAVTAAGTPPYTYQWYKSRTPGFTPAVGNQIAGQTSTSLVDAIPAPLVGSPWFYACKVTDSVSATSTAQALNDNVEVKRTVGQSKPIDVSRVNAYPNYN